MAMVAKRVTIVDVAMRAGVAVSSASAALNGRPGVSQKTRERVQTAAADLSFVPSLRAQSLSSKHAFAVGLVVQRNSDVLESDPFFGAFIAGVETVLPHYGYALVLHVGADREDAASRYRGMAASRRIDGAFLLDLEANDPRIKQLRDLGMPTVGINANSDEASLASVRQDSALAINSAVDHLVGLGHRLIAHVSGSPQYVHSQQRMQAWRTSLERWALPPGPLVQGDFTYDGGQRAADVLVQCRDRPTAVICANDLSAVGLIRRLQDLGLDVPADISVVGIDGIELGTYLRPSLTTVRTAPHLLGERAAQLLLDIIHGQPVVDVEITPAELVLRESTGAAPTEAV
ncbi:MAG: LacI family transcriptional regulator [Propionibacteriaceae bacterium]|nr:LacI family transcriptional regulator [Propionibacteriaceae bacterium]